MLPVLLLFAPIAWYMHRDNQKILLELACDNHPSNPQYDYDLIRIANSKLGINETTVPKWRTCPAGLCDVPETQWRPGLKCPNCEDNDKLIQFHFRQLLEEHQFLDDLVVNKDDVETWLIDIEVLQPERLIWCDGYPLEPCNPDDIKRFMEIKNRAYLKGEYNSVPLDDGGLDLIMVDWFRMKGASKDGAWKLYNSGIKAWEFDWG